MCTSFCTSCFAARDSPKSPSASACGRINTVTPPLFSLQEAKKQDGRFHGSFDWIRQEAGEEDAKRGGATISAHLSSPFPPLKSAASRRTTLSRLVSGVMLGSRPHDFSELSTNVVGPDFLFQVDGSSATKSSFRSSEPPKMGWNQ